MNTVQHEIKVLVVDDDERFSANAVRLLSAVGFIVEAANNGESCLDILANHSFDVVVLDQKMTGMNGLETLRIMRERGYSAEAIILTGHASVDDAVDGMNLGASDYLLKPVHMTELADKIRSVWERKQEKSKELRCR